MDDTERLLVPYDEAMRKLGDLGRTKFYELIDEKELDRVKIGRRLPGNTSGQQHSRRSFAKC
jgi:hypothetical protein